MGDAKLLKNGNCVLHGLPVAAGAHDHTDLDGVHVVRAPAARPSGTRDFTFLVLIRVIHAPNHRTAVCCSRAKPSTRWRNTWASQARASPTCAAKIGRASCRERV